MENMIINFVLFLWGVAGIPMIIRREAPWIITIRGWPAIAEGLFMVVACWGLIIAEIIYAIKVGH